MQASVIDSLSLKDQIRARLASLKPLVARHRLIYAALGDLMQREIHALKIDTRTPT